MVMIKPYPVVASLNLVAIKLIMTFSTDDAVTGDGPFQLIDYFLRPWSDHHHITVCKAAH